MNAEALTDRLERQAELIRRLVEDLDPEEASWRPGPGAWSILEIVNHLIDEEIEDFRTRLDLTLHHPEETWPAIDPEGWVRERRYQDRDLGESVTVFLKEREVSIRWLRSLEDPDWERHHRHPRLGKMRAGDLLCAWTAHDLLHVRQITRRRFLHVEELGTPYRSIYAGQW